MHRPSRISRSKHPNQLFVISRKDDKPSTNFLTLISAIALALTVLISVVTVFIFLLSCFYIRSIELALRFPVTEYLDFKDYVQTQAIYLATTAAITAVPTAGYALIAIVFFALLRLSHPMRQKKFVKVIPSVVGIWIAAFYLWVVFGAAWTAGDALKRNLPSMNLSQVFRKTEPIVIEGVLFLHSGRYIFLWTKDNVVVAIPNVEVQMIQTRSHLPLFRGTPSPSGASPTTTATPSPTLSPSTSPSSSAPPATTATRSPTA
jgi:hypothetical protein